MNIQPTGISDSYSMNFGRKYKTINLPKELKAKPLHRPPKGLMISLIPIALFGFGVGFWQVNKEEAMKKYWENILKQFFKAIENIEQNEKNNKDSDKTINYYEAIKFKKD